MTDAEKEQAYQNYLKEQKYQDYLAANADTRTTGEKITSGAGTALDYGLRAPGYVAGHTRNILAQSLNEVAPSLNLVKKEDLYNTTIGKAPSGEEYLNRAGVPEGPHVSDLPEVLQPAILRNLRGLGAIDKGGFFDPSPRSIAGTGIDMAVDPLLLTNIPSKIMGYGLKGAQKIGAPLAEAGTKVASFLSHFSPAETEQYLKNYPKVKELQALLEDRLNADVLRKKASSVVESLKNALVKRGQGGDLALSESLRGQNTTADLDRVKKSFGITDSASKEAVRKMYPKAVDAIDEMEKNLVATRPFEPEFYNTSAEQKGLEGLTHPEVRTQPEMLPAKKESIPGQQDMFGGEAPVLKPEYTDIPQPPRASAEAEKDLMKYLEEVQTKGVPYEENFPKLPQDEQMGLHFDKNDVVTKGATTKSELITPSKSEYFPQESSPWSEMVQEPLPIDMGSKFSGANAPISKTSLRGLRQDVGQASKFNNPAILGESAISKNREMANLYSNINESMARDAEQKALDELMNTNATLKESIKKAKSPVTWLTSASQGTKADIAAIAKATNQPEVYDLVNQLNAAKKMSGMSDGNKNSWIRRHIQEKAARAGLQGIDAASESGRNLIEALNTKAASNVIVPWGLRKYQQERSE